MNDMMYMQSWRPATLPSLVALATTVTCQNACRLNGAWSAITASSTYTFQMYDNTVSYAKPSPQDLNMQNAEIWSAERVETPLRTRGWHQRAVPWRRSRGSPAAQWFHWGCWTDCGGWWGVGGRHRALRHTADWHLPTWSLIDLSSLDTYSTMLIQWVETEWSDHLCLFVIRVFQAKGACGQESTLNPLPPSLFTYTALSYPCRHELIENTVASVKIILFLY